MRPPAPRRNQVRERRLQGIHAGQPERRLDRHQGTDGSARRQRRGCQGRAGQGIRSDRSLWSEHPAEGHQVRRHHGADGQQLQACDHRSGQDRPALRHQLVGCDEEERAQGRPRQLQGQCRQEPAQRPRYAEHRYQRLRFARRSGEVQRQALESPQRIG